MSTLQECHEENNRQRETNEDEEPQPSTSTSLICRIEEPEEHPILSGRTSSHIISIFDMVWTFLEVVLVLICILPKDQSSWEVALICLIPNIIQFLGALMMYKKTTEIQDSLILFRSCQLWLFLAFLTITLQAAFVTWTTISGVLSKFLIFFLILKFCWRFTAMFFINEFHNELELICESHSSTNNNNNQSNFDYRTLQQDLPEVSS